MFLIKISMARQAQRGVSKEVLNVYFIFPGIGRDLAVRLAEYGAHVIAVCRTQADLDSLKQQVGLRDMLKRNTNEN